MDVEKNVPILFEVRTVAKILALSRSKVYELLNSGALASVVVGRSRRVTQNQLVEFISALESQSI